MLILKENVADKKKRSFFKITKSVNYFWSDMKDALRKVSSRTPLASSPVSSRGVYDEGSAVKNTGGRRT
jgi:hypothetical protein